MEFKQVTSLLSDAAVDQHVCIRGWVYRKSVVGKKAFIRVRDSSGVIQVVIDSARLGEHIIGDLEETSLEASVCTCGKVKKSERAPGGYELEADYFTIIGPSRDFPIKGGEG
ncbi:MAG: OB-fold nucleic acid binding domain-containing protein, partial [Desulfurococcaceae archaeon]